MSLTATDLEDVRNTIESALTKQTQDIIRPIQNELQALRNDLKEIYDRLSALELRLSSIETRIMPAKEFEKLSIEQKLLRLNSELLIAAKQAGISLPR